MFFDPDYIKYLIQPIQEGKEIWTSHGTELVGNLENPIARAYGIIRGKYDPSHPRSNIYRMMIKKDFLEAGGFDSSKWYFDDDLSKVNDGKGSLSIEKSICYHNNPESLKEVYKHSIWVGKGLMQSWQIKDYTKKYLLRIIAFIILGIWAIAYSISQWAWRIVPLAIIGVIFLLIIIKTLQRTIKEKYTTHLVYVPLVMIMRWLGYGVGIIKHVFNF
jgi:hypothetical protein